MWKQIKKQILILMSKKGIDEKYFSKVIMLILLFIFASIIMAVEIIEFLEHSLMFKILTARV